MRATLGRNTVAAMLAGALLAVASPAIAQASPQSSDPKAPSAAAGATVRLKNYKSGKYLQAVSSANGARVVQQSKNDNYLQFWSTILNTGGTLYGWENWESKKNLGINGASSSSGAAAITANPSSDANQDWTKIWYGEWFALKNRKSGLCLGISGASEANGAQAAQFPCDGSANQKWDTVPV
ncbi:RICIN domain-containing protein [Streptomyces sp. NPDC007929]|uniref:RICIN domain-containing protein n=1 Tax=unclassified Streptomyces TaxID=2593676 RepID=UPI0036F00C12